MNFGPRMSARRDSFGTMPIPITDKPQRDIHKRAVRLKTRAGASWGMSLPSSRRHGETPRAAPTAGPFDQGVQCLT